jgi:RES domain-containing protein
VTPLPPPLGTGELVAWRLHRARFRDAGVRDDWDSGEGAFRWGGRWNSRGVRAVYCSLDPATAILEVAVHTGFAALDAVPHMLTAITITDPKRIHVVDPTGVADPAWPRPSNPTAAQQTFGDALLVQHPVLAIPSTVSTHSWNVIFLAPNAAGAYAMRLQEDFTLDSRLQELGGR